MQVGFKLKVINFLLILIYVINIVFYIQPVMANNPNSSKIKVMKNNIDFKRINTRKKINELKKRENLEINKLYTNQAELEDTRSQIKVYEVKLNTARTKLLQLESILSSATREQEAVARKAGNRIKQIYQGERIGILHLIFSAQDINSFLDRLYYQKSLAVYDNSLLRELRAKSRTLMASKRAVESEKNSIQSTINSMNYKRRLIATNINTSQLLINKLRTDRATYEAGERDLERQSAHLESLLQGSRFNSKDKKEIVRGGFVKPLSGTITSPFGWRKHPIFGSRSFHSGVDIAAPNRTPIKASNGGKVIYSGWYGGYGKVVIINHGEYQGNSTSTLYAHMSNTAVNVGKYVERGDVIGYEGTTGYSTGPHLHFEVRLKGKPTNPLNYI